MKDKEIVFGASVTTAALFMFFSQTMHTMSDVLLWIGGGVGLIIVPNYIFRIWRLKIDGG